MNHNILIQQLEVNQKIFLGLLTTVAKEEITWKPAEDKWCLLEIVCHLYDEEREDLRARLKHVLENPKESLPSIDPVGWVTSRNYMAKEYETAVADFLNERKQSIQWLHSLQSPDWKSAYVHHKFGPMSAEMFLANWVAHDYLHVRQIIRTKYQYLKQTTPEVTLLYAGEW